MRGTKAVIDLPNRTETGSGFSGLARSVCRIRIQFHETYNKPFSRRFTVINQDGGRRRCSFNIYSGTVITPRITVSQCSWNTKCSKLLTSCELNANIDIKFAYRPEMTMGQWVTGHGSSGSTNPSGSRGSRVSTRDPLTHDQVNKIPKTG